MFKNVASQKFIYFAFDASTGLPKTGDAANITPYVSKDYGSVTVLGTTTMTEMDSTNAKGFYSAAPTQAETNADTLILTGKSSTSNIVVLGMPGVIQTVPANFTTLVIDGSGRINAFMIGLMTTVFDGTSALMKAAFQGFFNVSSPVATAQSVNQGADNNVILANGTYGNSALKTLIDAIASQITALNNLSALANLYGSPLLEIPDTGDPDADYAFTLVIRDNEGKLVDLDSSPTIAAANAAGTDRSANLSAVSHPATGRYTFTYSVADDAVEESLRITCSGTVSAEARYIEWIGAVVDYDTTTIMNAIYTIVNSGTFGNSALKTLIDTKASQASVDDVPNNSEFAAAMALLATAANQTIALESVQYIRKNTAAAGGSNTITLDASASAVTDFYKYRFIRILSGTGAGQIAYITGYNGTSKQATIKGSWVTNPDATSVFVILGSASAGVDTRSVNAAAFEQAVADGGTYAPSVGPNAATSVQGKLDDLAQGISIIGTVQASPAPTASGFRLALSGAVPTNGVDDALLLFTSGSLALESAKPIASVTNVSGSTVDVTFDEPFTQAPSSGDTVQIKRDSHIHPVSQIAAGVRDVDNSSPAADSLGEAVADRDGYKLASDGLDQIPVTDPGGVASTFPKMVVQLWRRFFSKATQTSTQIKTYADNGTTVRTTQTVSDDGTTQTQGPAT